MTNLTAFLNARLDEDEAAATKATGTTWAWEATGDKDNSWAVGHVEGDDGRPLSGEIEHGQGGVIDGVCESINGNLADAAHITRHDPARVLREVAAIRHVLDALGYLLPVGVAGPADPGNDDPVLCALAAIWNDHPDYQPEWMLS